MNTKVTINNMITQQLRAGGVTNEEILNFYKTSIPRDEFVPKSYEEFAYSDMQIPLPNNQRMMTPLEEALIIQALELTGEEVVLEVGTGTGFLTAILSKLSKQVVSVDYFEEFTKKAQVFLEKYHCNNVKLITGDASQGYFDSAPYDVIIFSGAIDALTEIQKLQLLPGGKLIAILGDSPIMQAKLYTLGHNDIWTERLIFETNIPKLINKLNKKQFIF